MWFISLSLIMILFEEIIDVIFPSLFWSSNHSVGPIFHEALESQLKIWMRFHIENVGNYSASHGSLKTSASGIEPHSEEMAQKSKCTFHLENM